MHIAYVEIYWFLVIFFVCDVGWEAGDAGSWEKQPETCFAWTWREESSYCVRWQWWLVFKISLPQYGRHIYDWNIVNCDVKQPIQLNSTAVWNVFHWDYKESFHVVCW